WRSSSSWRCRATPRGSTSRRAVPARRSARPAARSLDEADRARAEHERRGREHPGQHRLTVLRGGRRRRRGGGPALGPLLGGVGLRGGLGLLGRRGGGRGRCDLGVVGDRKSTRLNSSHVKMSYAVFCLKKKTGNVLHCI